MTKYTEEQILEKMEAIQRQEAYDAADVLARDSNAAAGKIVSILKEEIDDPENWDGDEYIGEEDIVEYITAGAWIDDGEALVAVCLGQGDFVGTWMDTNLTAQEIRDTERAKLVRWYADLISDGYNIDFETGREDAIERLRYDL